ncbi:YaiI/YqxD family protein [Nitrogeniibacter aestuarii]|nr:YaiI/YqxD family protein [Nitrogeniibacter aestuarii]
MKNPYIQGMQIWIDADACPVTIRTIIFRAAERVQVHATLVANQYIRMPPSKWVSSVQVPSGFDVADNYIAERVSEGDLVITSDIPLAADVVERGGIALDSRGQRYTRENVREALAMRDFMMQMRDTGQVSGGPPPLSKADVAEFARQLDQCLARRPKPPANTGRTP